MSEYGEQHSGREGGRWPGLWAGGGGGAAVLVPLGTRLTIFLFLNLCLPPDSIVALRTQSRDLSELLPAILVSARGERFWLCFRIWTGNAKRNCAMVEIQLLSIQYTRISSTGHDEGGQLTEAVRRKPYCVVLFDEVEKAHVVSARLARPCRTSVPPPPGPASHFPWPRTERFQRAPSSPGRRALDG